MPDNSQWDIPVDIIAKNRAEYYAKQDDVPFKESLEEDTLPLFEADEYEIVDWAGNNMDWKDVKDFAFEVLVYKGLKEVDFQDGWVNGAHEIIEK